MRNKNLRALIASASALWLSGALAQFERPPAELELIQLNDELFVIHNPGSPGNATARLGMVERSYGGLSRLIDYSSGGSIRDWTQTLDNILQLGFETIVPGHGRPTTRDEMRSYRVDTAIFRDRVRELISEGISRDQLETVLREDFGWGNLHVQRGLDGIIGELQ